MCGIMMESEDIQCRLQEDLLRQARWETKTAWKELYKARAALARYERGTMYGIDGNGKFWWSNWAGNFPVDHLFMTHLRLKSMMSGWRGTMLDDHSTKLWIQFK